MPISSPFISSPSEAVVRRAAALVTALLVLAATTETLRAQTPDNDGEDLPALMQRLERLEDRIDVLAADRDEPWLTTRRSRHVRALVSEVLADAGHRTAMLEDELRFGYRKRIFLQSADGDFRLQFWGYFQQRYSANRQHDSPTDDFRSGFEVRRAKLKTAGRMYGENLRFAVNLGYDDDVGDLELQGATLQYHFDDHTFVKLGRFRSPLLREEQVSARRQLLAERSLVARTFVQNRTLGIGLVHQTDRWVIDAAFMAARDDLSRGQNWILALRTIRLVYGRLKDLRDFTSFEEDEPLLAVAGGLYYQDETSLGEDMVDFERFRWTVDVTWESPGANLFAAVVGNHEERLGDGIDQYGLVLQGGLFLGERLELVARYEWGDADRDIADLSVVTVGVNYYVDENDLKFTADLGYGINPVQSPWDSNGASWRRDRPGQEGQLVFRGQWVMQF